MGTSICEPRICSACQARISNSSVLRRTSANMPRVRLLSVSVLCLLISMHWIEPVSTDCWYNNGRYEEGDEVTTGEPCLNCTCNRGIPVCYLRVCPQLPNPPPHGCILLHRYKTCCPELICEDRPLLGNRIEARSETEDFDIYDKALLENACVANGSIYGPGSAMDSSSLCEYCYCLGGRQRCVKPKCLLPIEGCLPIYSSDSCCPVHYNCSEILIPTSTTTASPKFVTGDCLVSGKHYPEGGKILGVGHSICDNCYCIRGLLRCEPLSCAPPLLGCLPVVKPGECCAASYNCSGTIETRPEPNYGNFPIVSKDYAKLRKEVQKTSVNKWGNSVADKSKDGPYYVIAETPNKSTTKTHRIPGLFGTTRHFSGHSLSASTSRPVLHNSYSNVKTTSASKTTVRSLPDIAYKNRYDPLMKNVTFTGVYYATTNYEFQNSNYRRPVSTTNRPKNNDLTSYNTVNSISVRDKIPTYSTAATTSNIHKRDDALNVIDYLLDGRLNRRIDNQSRTSNIEDELSTTTDYWTKITTHLDTTVFDTTTTSEGIQHTTELDFNLNQTTNNTGASEKNKVNSTILQFGLKNENLFNNTQNISLTLSEDTEDGDGQHEDQKEQEDKIKRHKEYEHTIDDENKRIVNTNSVTHETDNPSSTLDFTTTTAFITTPDIQKPVTVRTVINSTDCIESGQSDGQKLRNVSEVRKNDTLEQRTATTAHSGDLTTIPDDVTIVDLESKVKVSTVTLHPFQKLPPELLILTKEKDGYYDYDFQPTLPPSLPNLRIIPFLPSDALDSKKKMSEKKNGYPLVDERVTDSNLFTFTNLFSPPIETEGGFVPKEGPPLLDSFYENSYHTTGVDVNAVTSISVPIITNQPKTNANSCLSDGREIQHGDPVPSKNVCMMCACYFGDIVCHEPQCPPTGQGCRKSNNVERSACCPHLICEDESPTVVLDRIEVTSNPRDVITVAEGILPPDPFRDVIRTEPAPNLLTLIGDMKPFFTRKVVHKSTTTAPNSTTPKYLQDDTLQKNVTDSKPESSEDAEYSLEKVLELLFADKLDETTKSSIQKTSDNMTVTSTATAHSVPSSSTAQSFKQETVTNKSETRENETDNIIRPTNDLNSGVGILKLAGCNIYGRMYRVGKIISELSKPCLECKCTDVGVQCTSLC